MLIGGAGSISYMRDREIKGDKAQLMCIYRASNSRQKKKKKSTARASGRGTWRCFQGGDNPSDSPAWRNAKAKGWWVSHTVLSFFHCLAAQQQPRCYTLDVTAWQSEDGASSSGWDKRCLLANTATCPLPVSQKVTSTFPLSHQILLQSSMTVLASWHPAGIG